ncbi:MAG: tRNA pseudouridine(38-40) synthase TruA [Candidatus Latescibacterota bacterium]|nr:MAG: tRNA pseudouridine(38-40) synthase TruA [Candidatus Latescibacterota bacterium]
MRNFKIRVEYDGTGFHGWQKQPGLRTVQGLMEDAVATIFGRHVPVHGAGRTDAGVHAIGQVCNFVVETSYSPVQVGRALSGVLPEDIQIRRVDEVDLEFHARFDACRRRYVYYLRTEPTAIGRRFAHVVTYPLDVERMRAAAQSLVGEKDFTSFTPTRSSDVPTVCDVRSVDIKQKDDVISIEILADHFLHHMVRVIVGTLIEVGRGRVSPEHMETILCRKDRAAAGPTVPPNGLFLVDVCYGD